MKLIDSTLYLEFNDAVQWLGVTENYLRVAISKGLKCWQTVNDPDDRRKVLIDYAALKAKYRALVDRKTGGDPYRFAKDQALLDRMEGTTEEQRLLSDIVDALMDNADFEYFRSILDRKDALEHAKACAWLRLLTSVKGKHDAAKYGFKSKEELIKKAAAVLADIQLKPLRVSHPHSLKRRMVQWNKQGRESVTLGYLGNSNAKKVNEKGLRLLIKLMSDPHKPPLPIVARLYNKEARQMGWKEIDPNTAGNYLNKPEVKRKWMLGRHGESVWYNEYDMTIRRENASAPDVLWILDGTPLDLYYQQTAERWNRKTGKHETRTTHYNRAYAFFVLDAFSWKFTAVLCQSEDMRAVRDALKKAVEEKMVLPRQLQYDQGAAIMAQSFLMEQLGVHQTPTRPYSPKAKVIEPAIGHFQNEVLRYYDNFAGLNITAKRQDSRYNPDFVHENRHNVPEWDELEKQFNEAIAIWNDMPTQGRKAPNKLYAQKSKGREIGRLAILDMFWEKRKGTYKYQSDGIHLEYGGREFIYQVNDPEFYKQYIRASFQVAFDRDTPERVYLYQDNKPVIWNGEPVEATAAELMPMALHDLKEGDRERLNKLMAMKDKIKNDTKEELAEINGEFDIAMGARYVHKDSYNDAEGRAKQTDWAKVLENEYL